MRGILCFFGGMDRHVWFWCVFYTQMLWNSETEQAEEMEPTTLSVMLYMNIYLYTQSLVQYFLI